MKSSRVGNSGNNNNNNNYKDRNEHGGQHHERRKTHQYQHQSGQASQQQYQGQRDRSAQRNQAGPHPDSSMGRDNQMGHMNANLGSIKFSPGSSTRELPPIETKADPSKKFTGRCRLFIGNLPHNTSENKLKSLFENHGEVGEVYLGPKSAFAFIKMDTRQNAEAARDALDCSMYEGRTLRVRLAAHAAAIRIKHLSPQVTNELLAYAFRYFGEIERAVVVVDDKGRSTGEGIVEYSRKQSALYAIKRCQQDCFLLTASPQPVLVEPFDQQDEDEGLPEKSINKHAIEFKEQRDVGPRWAEQGSFEHSFALRWKELYDVEKQKRERVEQEILEARRALQEQIEYSRLEHDTMQLRNKLQQLEDNRMKLQQMKEQSLSSAQQREESRRQQDMQIRQREEEVLRHQQLGDTSGLTQHESALRMQANTLQEILNNQDMSGSHVDTSASQYEQPIPTLNVPMPVPQRTFAEAAMMSFIPTTYPSTQVNQASMYSNFMPQMQPDTSRSTNINVIQQRNNGRPRKRGRF